MRQENIKIKHQWVTSVKKILPMINILHNLPPGENVEPLVSLVSHLLKHKGERGTIRILKEYRLAFQQFALKQSVTNIPFCKTDRYGLPRKLSFLRPDLKDGNSIRYSLSVLRLIEEFRCKPEYLVDTIISNSNAKHEVLSEILEYIRGKPRILKVLPKEIGDPRLVLSNKAGPNGPASITCLQDLAALRQPGNETLYTYINNFIKDNVIKVDMDKYESPSGEWKHSKLVLLSDKACKTRVIAIADWWSNVCLSGLHDAFMKGLRRIPSDVTYFQDKIPTFVKKLGSGLYSSDMTAFTDRFPIELEIAVIEAKYGYDVGQMWKHIVTDREFYHKNGSVRYQCGNPMGLLSSWAVSTFTHHVVKAWCAHKCGIKYYKNYLILGDDTLDSDRSVYTKYIQTIKNLGVSISTSKCTLSNSGYAEFAKRLFTPEGEVTGLPVHLLDGMKSNPEQVLELVRICRSRGYQDSFLRPALENLLSKKYIRNSKTVADILSLPESLTGLPPLLEGKDSSVAISNILNGTPMYQEALLKIARSYLFWKMAGKLQISPPPKHISPMEIDNNHPLVFALNERVDLYLPAEAFCDDTWEEDEYYIYNQWMEGKYDYLVNIPSIDTYKYYNRGHRITKCKFDVAKLVISLGNGDCNIPLTPRTVYTNQDLYDIALESITPKRNHRVAVTTSFTK
jgi:hypothetical protein